MWSGLYEILEIVTFCYLFICLFICLFIYLLLVEYSWRFLALRQTAYNVSRGRSARSVCLFDTRNGAEFENDLITPLLIDATYMHVQRYESFKLTYLLLVVLVQCVLLIRFPVRLECRDMKF